MMNAYLCYKLLQVVLIVNYSLGKTTNFRWIKMLTLWSVILSTQKTVFIILYSWMCFINTLRVVVHSVVCITSTHLYNYSDIVYALGHLAAFRCMLITPCNKICRCIYVISIPLT